VAGRLARAALLRALLASLSALLSPMASAAPLADSRIAQHRLAPCSDKPNCVSSQAQGRAHVSALAFTGAPEAAMARLTKILQAMPRVRVVTAEGGYLHAEVQSRVMRFVDDLEFVLDAAGSVIHVRSGARVGYWDFGVNRRRVEAIRTRFADVRDPAR
jgi:uncharacterized protein (DUF1499 family)